METHSWKIYHKSLYRLNRTMQYGNYQSARACFRDVSRFKSYYVVWKLMLLLLYSYYDIMFKSYYVVWKQARGEDIFQGDVWGLNRTMQYGNYLCNEICNKGICKFKSYYVVWKLRSSDRLNCRRYSLNRTMQYGNVIYDAHSQGFPYCLNRTMQYGNYLLRCFFWSSPYRLNRTMQYGNANALTLKKILCKV